jgi:tetratricopeptide (TPR) repeat protein
MTRDNLLFSTIGILFGFIVGFMFASSMSQRAPAGPANPESQNLPADHPRVGSGGETTPGQMQAQVTAQLEKARQAPDDFDAQLKAAELYYQIQRFDSAIEFLMRANKLRPDDYQTLVALGLVNLDAEHFEASEKWYRAALAKKSDDVAVLAGLCASTLGKGDAKAAEVAIAQLEKVDSTSPDLPNFKERLARLKGK